MAVTTVWIAVNEISDEVEVFSFAEPARNLVFEWAKNHLKAVYNYDNEEDLMEEANECVIAAEESPWQGMFRIEERIVREE